LNLGKTGDLYKTNPSQLRRVSPPPLTIRKEKWQTDETNHVYVGVKRAAGNRLTYEKELPDPKKTITFSKRITPPSPHALPSRQGKDVMMAFDFAGILRRPCQSDLLQIRRYVPGIPPGVAQSSDKASSYPRTSPKSVLIVASLASGHTREVGFLPATYCADIMNHALS
jgi:hypothetical protein